MNIVETIFKQAQPTAPALVQGERVLTYGELDALTAELAKSLQNHVAQPGGRIALSCPDGPEYIILALSILRANFCLIPVAGELTESERGTLLELTAPVARLDFWTDPDIAEACRQTVENLTPLTFPQPDWEDDLRALNPAFIRFSSGTTGASKGIVISHQTLRDRICAANAGLQIGPEDRVLWVLPMSHHFAVSIILYLWHGAATVLPTSHLGGDILEAALTHRATVFYASPFHFQLLASDTTDRPWPDLRLTVSTAAELPRSIAENFHTRFGLAPSQALGVIEVGLPAVNIHDPLGHPGSIGRPQPAFDFELRDDQGNPVSDGLPGELFLRGPGLFDAYLQPWRTREEVLTNGWFHTGDIATRDEDGFYTLQGRSHNVLNIGGMKCFPEEIEEILREHPEITEVRVSGMKHPQFGVVPVAEIIPRDPASPPAARELSKFCRPRLSSYKIPVTFRVVESIPKTASGKISRQKT